MTKITQSSKAMLLAIKVSTGTSRRKETPLLKIIMETYEMQRNNQLATCIAVNLLWSLRCNKYLPIQKHISFSVITWSYFLRRFLKNSCRSVSICNVNIVVYHGNEIDFLLAERFAPFAAIVFLRNVSRFPGVPG